MSKLKNKFNRVGSDASQLQKFADEVCDNFSNEEGKWPDLSEGVGTKLYKHSISVGGEGDVSNVTVISSVQTPITDWAGTKISDFISAFCNYQGTELSILYWSSSYPGGPLTVAVYKNSSSSIVTSQVSGTISDNVTPL